MDPRLLLGKPYFVADERRINVWGTALNVKSDGFPGGGVVAQDPLAQSMAFFGPRRMGMDLDDGAVLTRHAHASTPAQLAAEPVEA